MIVYASDNLVVCGPGPSRIYAEDAAGVKWCFYCRKRVEFTDRFYTTIEPSYYGPWAERTCPRGHADGDLFPGWTREWGE